MMKVFHGERHVICDRCEGVMYRVNLETLSVLWEEDGAQAPKPIKLIVGDRIWLFCTKDCMIEWAEAAPMDVLACGGYPVM